MRTEESHPQEKQRTELAEVIERRSQEIVDRWLVKVQTELQVHHIESTDLQDAIHEYLARLSEALRAGGSVTQDGMKAWEDVAREHALTRVRLGFNVEQLVHELMLLRRTVTDILIEEGFPLDGHHVAQMADLIDIAIAATLKSYVQSRDYATRREHAEHIGFLAHQLKNPLTAATLSAERLGRLGAASESYEQTLARLKKTLQQVNHLLDEVLVVERLESGQQEAHWEETTLGAVLDDVVDRCRQSAREKGLAFKASYDPSQHARLDPHLMRSAVDSLLENAVKYTDSGEVALFVEDRPSELVVHVRDACPGISEEELRIIFEPFRRGSTGKQGTGLGLSIARRAVEAMHGTIQAESPGERGCHFWFTLPRAH